MMLSFRTAISFDKLSKGLACAVPALSLSKGAEATPCRASTGSALGRG
jgi:hypothetical protein